MLSVLSGRRGSAAGAVLDDERPVKRLRGKGNSSYIGAIRTALARKDKIIKDFPKVQNMKEFSSLDKAANTLRTNLEARRQEVEQLSSKDEGLMQSIQDLKAARTMVCAVKEVCECFLQYKHSQDRGAFMAIMDKHAAESISEEEKGSALDVGPLFPLQITYPPMIIKELLYTKTEALFDNHEFTNCFRMMGKELLMKVLQSHVAPEELEQHVEGVQMMLFTRFRLT